MASEPSLRRQELPPLIAAESRVGAKQLPAAVAVAGDDAQLLEVAKAAEKLENGGTLMV